MMNKLIKYLFCTCIFSALLVACTKNTDTTTIDNGSSTPIVGITTIKGDTTIVTVGKLAITATKTSPCYPSTEIFTLNADVSSIPHAATCNWYFGDGHTDAGFTVKHGYDNAASFVVLVEIKNDTGLVINSATFPLKAWGQQLKPVAIFSSKQDFAANPNYITFNSASSVNHGSIVNFSWVWGDGIITNTANALTRHEFPVLTEDKNYRVKLIITTDAGCTADTTVNVWVPATYPITGNFNAVSYNGCTNESIVFTPAATNVPTGSVYYWHFSNGTGDTSGTYIKYSFYYLNDYDVIMYIKLNGRTIYTTHKVVHANGPDSKPTAAFYGTWKSSDASSVLMSFNSQSTVKHGSIDGFQWDFGNGKTDNDYNSYIENSYTKLTDAKTYQVRLIVTGNGCADTAYHSYLIPAK